MSLLNIHIGQINYIILCDRVYVFVKQLCSQYSSLHSDLLSKSSLNCVHIMRKDTKFYILIYSDFQLITQKM